MDYFQMIARLEQKLLGAINRRLAGLAEFSLLSTTSATGDTDSAKTEDTNTDDQRPARRTESWGFRGRPATDGVRGLVLRLLGGESGLLVGIVTDARYGKQDLDVGESAQYSSVNPAAVLAAKTGKTTITSTDADGVVQSKLEQNADGSVTLTGAVATTAATFSFDSTGKLVVTTTGGKDMVITSDGKLDVTSSGVTTIKATANLTIDASGHDLSLKATTIKLDATDVKVTVSNKMDVS